MFAFLSRFFRDSYYLDKKKKMDLRLLKASHTSTQHDTRYKNHAESNLISVHKQLNHFSIYIIFNIPNIPNI